MLLLAYPDVDSLCACKILQALFKADDIQHTVVPVSGKADLQAAFTSHADQVRGEEIAAESCGITCSTSLCQVKCVVLINCGGCANLLELLQPEEDVRLYVVDR